MNEFNKKNVRWGINVLFVIVWALLTIATCAGVWNFCPEKAVKWFALALFVVNGIAIWKYAKTLK